MEHLSAPHCDPLNFHSYRYPPAPIYPGGPMQFCALLLLCVYVTWPLPFHAIVQQTDAVPPSTLIIPVIPISTVPAEPAVIPPSTSQVFFLSFSIFTLPPPLFFCSLSVGHFLIPAIPPLADGAEGLSARESGKVWRLSLTNSICASTSRRKWKAPKKDSTIRASKRGSLRVDLILGYFGHVLAFMLQHCMFCSLKRHVRTYAGCAVLIWCERQCWYM